MRITNKTFIQQHIATLQLFSLATFFTLPLIFGIYFPFSPQQSLENILAFEFGVLIYGFYLTGFLYLPVAISDNIWVRRISFLLACLMAIPFTSGYRQEFGFYGFLGFCALLFVNYSPVFIASIKFRERTRLTVEAGLRCVVYILIYMSVATSMDMRANVSNWSGSTALLFGAVYFGVLAIIERQRYFSKAVNVIFHVVNGTFVRTPKSRIRYVKGEIAAHVLVKNNIHRGLLLLAAGSACSVISLIFLYGTLGMDSRFAFVAIWIFFAPFLLLGTGLVFVGITHPFIAWRKGPSLLKIQEQALKADDKLYAVGTIPCYSKHEERTSFNVQLIHYKVDTIAGEEFIVRVKELLNEQLTGQHLKFQTTDSGTRFEVRYSLPVSNKKQIKSGSRHIWHLQASMHEEMETRGTTPKNYSWTVAFPLPLPLP